MIPPVKFCESLIPTSNLSLDGYQLLAGMYICGYYARRYEPDPCFDRIVVYSPQIYENYSLQSGEGLSILFVVIWLLGDACNLVGAIMGGLLPTVVLLGLYVSRRE